MSNRRDLMIGIFIATGIVLVLAIIACPFLGCFAEKPANNPSLLIEINTSEDFFNLANYKQNASYIKLSAHDGKLYRYQNMKGQGVLSCFEDGSFRNICKVNGTYIGIRNDCLFYLDEDRTGNAICCINLKDMEHSDIVTVDHNNVQDSYFSKNGVYFPKYQNRSAYWFIDDSLNIEKIQQSETYTFGDYSYVIEGELSDTILVRYDQSGDRYSYEKSIPYGDKTMIPCDTGLLIHNETNGDFLYFVEAETGKAIELFTVDCIHAYSTVNVHEGNVYLSFVRYTDMGPLGLAGKRDENDELNGTYRICLEDYSVKKISDKVYNGLFIFDDTGIYASNDDYRIFKLDFDGNILQEIV